MSEPSSETQHPQAPSTGPTGGGSRFLINNDPALPRIKTAISCPITICNYNQFSITQIAMGSDVGLKLSIPASTAAACFKAFREQPFRDGATSAAAYPDWRYPMRTWRRAPGSPTASKKQDLAVRDATKSASEPLGSAADDPNATEPIDRLHLDTVAQRAAAMMPHRRVNPPLECLRRTTETRASAALTTLEAITSPRRSTWPIRFSAARRHRKNLADDIDTSRKPSLPRRPFTGAGTHRMERRRSPPRTRTLSSPSSRCI